MKTSKSRTFVGQSAYFKPRLTFCYLDAIFKKSCSRSRRLQNFVDFFKQFLMLRKHQTCVPARSVFRGAVALSAGRFGLACTFSEGKPSCCSVLIRPAPAPTHTCAILVQSSLWTDGDSQYSVAVNTEE